MQSPPEGAVWCAVLRRTRRLRKSLQYLLAILQGKMKVLANNFHNKLRRKVLTQNPELYVELLAHKMSYLDPPEGAVWYAFSFRMCLHCEVLKGTFPWRTRYPLS